MPTSVNKRLKEKLRQEKQRDKAQKREDRRANIVRPEAAPGEDPDLVGIVPGPQPVVEDV
jgi:hypothetical protein